MGLGRREDGQHIKEVTEKREDEKIYREALS